MEQWEIDLRSTLEKELPDVYYKLSGGEGGFYLGGGKGAKINFEVAMIKAAKNWKPEAMWKNLPRKKKKRLKKYGWKNCGYEYQIQLSESGKKKVKHPMISDAIEQDFIYMMKMLEQKSKNI